MSRCNYLGAIFLGGNCPGSNRPRWQLSDAKLFRGNREIVLFPWMSSLIPEICNYDIIGNLSSSEIKGSAGIWFSGDFKVNRSYLICLSSLNIRSEIWRRSLLHLKFSGS